MVVSTVLLMGVFFLSSKVLESLPRFPSFAAIYASMVISYTNENRHNAGMDNYVPNELLAKAAQMKANDMAKKGYFSHVSPDGTQPWYWIEQSGYVYKYAGENLAIDFVDSKDVTNAWMSSPTHRANILNSDLKEIGVATAVGMYQGRETTFVVQMFGTPAEKPVAIAPVQTPKETAHIAVETAVEKRVEGAYTDQSSLLAQVAASPKKATSTLYFIFASIVSLLVLTGAIFEFRKHHKGIWLAGGVLVIAAIMLGTFLLQSGQGIVGV